MPGASNADWDPGLVTSLASLAAECPSITRHEKVRFGLTDLTPSRVEAEPPLRPRSGDACDLCHRWQQHPGSTVAIYCARPVSGRVERPELESHAWGMAFRGATGLAERSATYEGPIGLAPRWLIWISMWAPRATFMNRRARDLLVDSVGYILAVRVQTWSPMSNPGARRSMVTRRLPMPWPEALMSSLS